MNVPKHLRHMFYGGYSKIIGSLPDETAIPLHFRLRAGYWPDMRSPRTFNELIQYRKLHGPLREYARLADKVLIKDHVREVLGESYLIPTLWHGVRLPPPSGRDWALPIVIKSNHFSGRITFVRSPTELQDPTLDSLTQRWMRRPGYPHLKEHFYDLIDPQIIVEPMIADNPSDYKFYVFSGQVRCIHVDTDRFAGHRRNFFDREWRPLPFSLRYPPRGEAISAPRHLLKMIDAAQTLGAGYDFVRVDFFDLPEGPKFGEMTFTPGGGFERFSPVTFDRVLGDYWRGGTKFFS